MAMTEAPRCISKGGRDVRCQRHELQIWQGRRSHALFKRVVQTSVASVTRCRLARTEGPRSILKGSTDISCQRHEVQIGRTEAPRSILKGSTDISCQRHEVHIGHDGIGND